MTPTSTGRPTSAACCSRPTTPCPRPPTCPARPRPTCPECSHDPPFFARLLPSSGGRRAKNGGGAVSALSRRRFLQLAAGVGAVSAVPALRSQAMADDRDGASDLPAGEWLAGDFHCHTTYSHDVWSGPGDDNTGPEDFYTLGWTPGEQITIAETRALD